MKSVMYHIVSFDKIDQYFELLLHHVTSKIFVTNFIMYGFFVMKE